MMALVVGIDAEEVQIDVRLVRMILQQLALQLDSALQSAPSDPLQSFPAVVASPCRIRVATGTPPLSRIAAATTLSSIITPRTGSPVRRLNAQHRFEKDRQQARTLDRICRARATAPLLADR